MDRVQLLDGRQRGGLALADQCAFSDQGTADTAGNRCRYGGVTEVQAGAFQGSLGGGHFGIGLQEAGLGVVIFLAADSLVVDQFAVALLLQTRLVQGGLGLCQGGAGAVMISFQWRWVDQEQHIALFDVTAFAVHPLEHHARDPRAHFGGARRQDAAAEFAADGQWLQLQGFYPHLRCGGFFVLLGAVATAGQGQAQKRHERQWAQARGEGSRHADLPMMTAPMVRQVLPMRLLTPVGRV
ncbi:hypothetical protein D3C80_1267400 [compost metagenome]